jgi:hypothetical protein
MKHLLFLLCLGFALSSRAENINLSQGIYLEQFLRINSAARARPALQFANPRDEALWWQGMGYLRGIMDSALLASTHKDKAPPAYLLPGNWTLEQVLLIVTKFVNEHPEKLHLPSAQIIEEALSHAFPNPEFKG